MSSDAFTRINCADEDAWLVERSKGIGGSDASAIIGQNPYKTNEALWLEKTGQLETEDISDNPFIKYGKAAESSLRQLFKLDFPEFKVYYRKNQLLRNKWLPWMQASLDGELTDKDGRKGVLEIKTTEILRSMQREKWKGRIPTNYLAQCMHYLLVTGYEFVILKAQLKTVYENNDVRIQVNHYRIERSDHAEDLEYLLKSEIKFWKQVEAKERPSLLLPEI